MEKGWVVIAEEDCTGRGLNTDCTEGVTGGVTRGVNGDCTVTCGT